MMSLQLPHVSNMATKLTSTVEEVNGSMCGELVNTRANIEMAKLCVYCLVY